MKRPQISASKGKQQVHSYSAKPAHNAKYYKYFLFKFKSSHNKKKKVIAPVQGIRYNSRPVIYPQSQEKSLRDPKQSLVNVNNDCKECRLNMNGFVSNITYGDMIKDSYAEIKCTHQSRSNIKSSGHSFIRYKLSENRREHLGENFSAAYIDDKYEAYKNTGYTEMYGSQGNSDHFMPRVASKEQRSRLVNEIFQQKAKNKSSHMNDPSNCELIQLMRINKSLAETELE